MRTTWTASARSLRAFEALNVGLWLLTAVLIATVFDNNRGYWLLLLSWTAVFPFSAWADEYVLLIRYNPGFRMLFWRCPAMIPFAFGWFFTLPLILIWESGVIASLPLAAQVSIVFAVFVAWGFVVEVASASSNLCVYRWPERWKIGGMPRPVAIIDGSVHTLTFLLFFLVTTSESPSKEKAGEFGVQSAWVSVQPSAEQLKEVRQLIDEGKLKTHIETVLPLSQVKKAHELSKAGHTRGKIVLRVAE